MTFKKITGNEYLLDDQDLVVKVEKLIKTFNGGLNYEKNLDAMLADSITSRIVATDFIKQYKEVLDEIDFVTIQVKLLNRQIHVTVGSINDNNKVKYLNGVLYD